MADSGIAGSGSVDQINAAFIAAQESKAAAGKPSKTGATTSQNQLTSDVNFFLTMLTTQLKNQDPTSPMDATAFTQQIATYSGVQQQVTTNANLEKLLAAQNQSTASTAVSYIGKEIESAGSTGTVFGGQGAFSYTLPKTASSAQITLTDSAGNVVFRGQGTTNLGRNVVVWNGQNSATSQQEPDGVYTLAVVATDGAGKSIEPVLHAVTIVSGVETSANGETMLNSAGGPNVNYNDVQAVRQPTRIAASPAYSATDTTDESNT